MKQFRSRGGIFIFTHSRDDVAGGCIVVVVGVAHIKSMGMN